MCGTLEDKKRLDHIGETISGVGYIVLRPEAIDKVERNYGYFALLSNENKDPFDALKIYRTKDF